MISVFFFFKQKTAYEVRISDWSSDVCSSDLGGRNPNIPAYITRTDPATSDREAIAQHGRPHSTPPSARRPLRPRHHLPAGVRHRPVRLPLRLLHGGGDDLPAQGGPPDAGGARPRMQRLDRKSTRLNSSH